MIDSLSAGYTLVVLGSPREPHQLLQQSWQTPYLYTLQVPLVYSLLLSKKMLSISQQSGKNLELLQNLHSLCLNGFLTGAREQRAQMGAVFLNGSSCIGPVLVLHCSCIGPVLVLCWSSIAPALVPYWSCIGPVLVLCWFCIAPVLVLHWSRIGPVLVLHCSCIHPVLVLHCSCIRPVLVLYWSCLVLALV